MENLQIVPVPKGVQPQYVEMMVPLYSHGCEKKVKRALARLKGIYSVEVDYGMQKVTVWGICNRDAVLATIRKKRREARFWYQLVEADDGEVGGAEREEEKAHEQASSKDVREKAALQRGFRLRRSWRRLWPLALVLY